MTDDPIRTLAEALEAAAQIAEERVNIHPEDEWEHGSSDSAVAILEGIRALSARIAEPPAAARIRELEAERDRLREACDEALNVLIGCTVSAGGCDDEKHIADAKRSLRAALRDERSEA